MIRNFKRRQVLVISNFEPFYKLKLFNAQKKKNVLTVKQYLNAQQAIQICAH